MLDDDNVSFTESPRPRDKDLSNLSSNASGIIARRASRNATITPGRAIGHDYMDEQDSGASTTCMSIHHI